MTANVPIVLVQFLALVFAIVVALGVALGVYAARSLKRAEQQLAAAEAPVNVTNYEPVVDGAAVESID